MSTCIHYIFVFLEVSQTFQNENNLNKVPTQHQHVVFKKH